MRKKNIKIYKLYLYVNVLVQFYLWFKIYFSLFWGKVMYDNKLEIEDKIEPEHWHLILVLWVFVWAQEMWENAQFMEYKAPTKWDVIIYTPPLVG